MRRRIKFTSSFSFLDLALLDFDVALSPSLPLHLSTFPLSHLHDPALHRFKKSTTAHTYSTYVP